MILADLIREASKYNSIIISYIYGELGVGKTSYALWTAYDLLGNWEKVLDYLFFRPEEVLRSMVKVVSSGRKLPIVIMDDAGIWLDRMTWWESDKVEFMKFFNLVRTVTNAVLFTTPSEELPRQILNKCSIRINVRRTSYDEIKEKYGEDGFENIIKHAEANGVRPLFSLATGYLVKTLPSFIHTVRKDFYDVFPTHYPPNVFERYERKRLKAVTSLLRSWEAEMNAKRTDLSWVKKMVESGAKRSDVVKMLINMGVSRATAYRWVKKVVEANELTTT
ncbi:MAG: hypothetical protein N3G48_07645 [Sulfolobales archaeon]|nr:hypothetical protein [Sulfolobales archaeon]